MMMMMMMMSLFFALRQFELSGPTVAVQALINAYGVPGARAQTQTIRLAQ